MILRVIRRPYLCESAINCWLFRDTVTFHWAGDGGQRAWMKNALFESQVLFTA